MCSTCGQRQMTTSSQPRDNAPVNQYNAVPQGPCNYTLDQLKIWAQKLECFKSRALYIQYKINAGELNRAIGTVLSAINIPTNICYFQKELDRAQAVIMVVMGSGQC